MSRKRSMKHRPHRARRLRHAQGRRRHRRALLLSGLIGLMAVAWGVYSLRRPQPDLGLHTAIPIHITRNRDLLESPNPKVQTAYRFAVSEPEAMHAIPCYCGCSAHNHRDLYDCYVESDNGNGRIALTRHAENCTVCLNIALDTQSLLNEGASIGETRRQIDRAYGRIGLGTPTPIPRP